MKFSVLLRTVAEETQMEPIFVPEDYENRKLVTDELNRPGLQLTGFYKFFDRRRLQIVGRVENTYLESFANEERLVKFERLFSEKISALVVCHGVEVMPECVAMAQKYDVPLFKTDADTSEFMAQLTSSLKFHLAQRVTIHGVLVEVHGEGILITGESGIGKSETAVELMKRGHRLIADDAVEIKKVNRLTLMGSAPPLIRYYMEVRGIGIINARRIFGVSSVKLSERIDLVVSLETWQADKLYDRLGLETEYTEILGVSVPHVVVPVRPGRNLAIIMELAAMKNRLRKFGYNDALELQQMHDEVENMDYNEGRHYF